MERKRPKDQLVIPTPDQAKAAGLPKDVIDQMEHAGVIDLAGKKGKQAVPDFGLRGVEYPIRAPAHKLSVDERKARRVKNSLKRQKQQRRRLGHGRC